MKRFVVLCIIAVCALLLSGCATPAASTPDTSTTDDNQWFEVHHVPVDGYTVTCLVMTSEDTFSCDWAHAK